MRKNWLFKWLEVAWQRQNRSWIEPWTSRKRLVARPRPSETLTAWRGAANGTVKGAKKCWQLKGAVLMGPSHMFNLLVWTVKSHTWYVYVYIAYIYIQLYSVCVCVGTWIQDFLYAVRPWFRVESNPVQHIIYIYIHPSYIHTCGKFELEWSFDHLKKMSPRVTHHPDSLGRIYKSCNWPYCQDPLELLHCICFLPAPVLWIRNWVKAHQPVSLQPRTRDSCLSSALVLMTTEGTLTKQSFRKVLMWELVVAVHFLQHFLQHQD